MSDWVRTCMRACVHNQVITSLQLCSHCVCVCVCDAHSLNNLKAFAKIHHFYSSVRTAAMF